MPRRMRSNRVAVHSYEPASPPWLRSAGTSAGSVSVGGSSSHPHRMSPGSDHTTWPGDRRLQAPEPLAPLVAPDLKVHVDDVVVTDREPSEPVAHRVRPLLIGRPIAPHDADTSAEVDDPVCTRRPARLELRRRAEAVRPPILGDRYLGDPFSGAIRDLAIRVRVR